MINRNNIAIAKVASKSPVRPELSCVAYYGDRTVATDSFRLIEMSAGGKKKGTPELYWAKELKAIKIKKGEVLSSDVMKPALSPVHGDQYPKIDTLFDRFSGKKCIEVKVNAEYLADICNILKDLDPFQAIVLKIPTEGKFDAITITAETPKKDGEQQQRARALLMPMTK